MKKYLFGLFAICAFMAEAQGTAPGGWIADICWSDCDGVAHPIYGYSSFQELFDDIAHWLATPII